MAMTRGNRAFYASVGTLAAALLVLGGVMWIGGEEDVPEEGKPSTGASRTPGPVGTYTTPEDWTEPERWAALPRAEKTNDRGFGVGFPDEEEGAVAMLVAQQSYVAEGDTTLAERQADSYLTYASQADKTPKQQVRVKQALERREQQVRAGMGVPGEGDLPPGAYVRTQVIGFKVVMSEDGEVGAFLLSKTTTRSSETAKERADYAVVRYGAKWEAGDWKVSGEVSNRVDQQGETPPRIAVAGDPEFNREGWTAIREAS
ncbi:hypothetical protein ACFY7N_29095 [Streptomyces albidoflavus]